MEKLVETILISNFMEQDNLYGKYKFPNQHLG
jgi:hypothetical protein